MHFVFFDRAIAVIIMEQEIHFAILIDIDKGHLFFSHRHTSHRYRLPIYFSFVYGHDTHFLRFVYWLQSAIILQSEMLIAEIDDFIFLKLTIVVDIDSCTYHTVVIIKEEHRCVAIHCAKANSHRFSIVTFHYADFIDVDVVGFSETLRVFACMLRTRSRFGLRLMRVLGLGLGLSMSGVGLSPMLRLGLRLGLRFRLKLLFGLGFWLRSSNTGFGRLLDGGVSSMIVLGFPFFACMA